MLTLSGTVPAIYMRAYQGKIKSMMKVRIGLMVASSGAN